MTDKEYKKLKKGNRIFPIISAFKKSFPEYLDSYFYLATKSKRTNFPQPLTLRIKKRNYYGKMRWLSQTQRWSGHWFKVKK